MQPRIEVVMQQPSENMSQTRQHTPYFQKQRVFIHPIIFIYQRLFRTSWFDFLIPDLLLTVKPTTSSDVLLLRSIDHDEGLKQL